MRVFGCTWKINFPEIIFSWPGVLKALAQKWFEVKIFTSNHFRTHAQREREREPSTSTSPIFEPTDLRTDHAFDFVDLRTHELHFDPEPSAYEPSTSPATQSLRATNWSSTHWSMNPRTYFRPRAFDPWAFDFTGDLEPSRHEPTNRSLSLSLSLSLCGFDFLCDFDQPTNPRAFDLWFFCCCCGGVGGGVLVVFLLCGGGFCVVGDGK